MNFKNLFQSSITFKKFLETGNEKDKDKILNLYKNIHVDVSLKSQIQNIKKDINILAFGEIWCPDCILNIPPVYAMTILNSNINLKITKRENNENYLKDYLIDGKAKIPTFIIMDENFNVLGSFIERPKIVKQVEEKGKQINIVITKKNYRNGEFTKDVIKEILNIISTK